MMVSENENDDGELPDNISLPSLCGLLLMTGHTHSASGYLATPPSESLVSMVPPVKVQVDEAQMAYWPWQ
jgi:hypothetical protein